MHLNGVKRLNLISKFRISSEEQKKIELSRTLSSDEKPLLFPPINPLSMCTSNLIILIMLVICN